MNIALSLNHVKFSRYEQKILHDINLAASVGDFIMVIGPNGSGKSSLLKIINGSIKPDQGEILIHGQNIVGLPVHKIATTVATLTQDIHHSTFSDLTVAMNLNLALGRSLGQAKTEQEKLSYLASFNPSLVDRFNVLVGHLSGGQRQSLALAMCFAHTPKILLLDEHTSALDPKAAASLMTLTNNHVCEKKLTTIMITHSLEQALQYGNRLVAINEGRIVADLAASEKASLQKQDLVSLAY